MIEFNALTDEWLGVIDQNGNEKLVGLYDYLVNAHHYRRSAENDFLAIIRVLQQRLAEVMIMDAFGSSKKTLKKLLDKGYFDPEILDKYFKDVVDSGHSFNFFDPEHPFLQTDLKTFKRVFKENAKSTSAATLNPKMASGNNKVFLHPISAEEYLKNTDAEDIRNNIYDSVYNPKIHPEDACKLSFVEYANCLLISLVISGSGGKGYSPGLIYAKQLPVMYHLDPSREENLFKSILMNIAFDKLHSAADDKPLWRWESYEDGLNFINNPGLDDIEEGNISIPPKMGMFFPVRYFYPDLSSVDEKNKTVSRVYKSKMVFEKETMTLARKQWIERCEPSVSLKIKKKENEESKILGPVCFSETNRSWLDIKSYSNIPGGGTPKSLISFKELDKDLLLQATFGKPIMTAYYLTMDQAKYLTQGRYQCELPDWLLQNIDTENVVSAITDFISFVESKSIALLEDVRDLNKILKSMQEDKKGLKTVERIVVNRFLRHSEGIFKNKFLPSILTVKDLNNVDELNKISKLYREEVHSYSKMLWAQVPVPYGKSIAVQKKLAELRKEKQNGRKKRN